MCSLCLVGRKVFICEEQLNQHISSGDLEVDGSESERGGFTGHHMCEFCKSTFYGGNELYTHMSREHYTCHICQRLRPAQYEYYGNNDDLEDWTLLKHTSFVLSCHGLSCNTSFGLSYHRLSCTHLYLHVTCLLLFCCCNVSVTDTWHLLGKCIQKLV